ncbi:MAG: hypothetical protein E7261_08920 [Lachnospiraceae bacterium]|nr:hypothetical protein [Lachnospiraceae bacterium]
MQKNLIKYVVPIVLIIIGVLWYLLSSDVLHTGNATGTVINLGKDIPEQSDTYEVSEHKETSTRLIAVHICGAVVNPGVYQFTEEVRVIQVIEAAGGVCDGAMEDYLNLAQHVSDGERIYVPSEEEVLTGQFTGAFDNSEKDKLSININTASRDELMQLPGIGESKADSIILYRNEYGSFKSKEDIMLVDGIKEVVYDKIKDYIKIQN